MKSAFCQWLTELSDLAEKENIIVEAKYHDGLECFFSFLRLSPEAALPKYKDLSVRCKAIEAESKKFKCYEINTVQARVFGCKTQCKECAEKQNSLS